jgi:hypothetical protein
LRIAECGLRIWKSDVRVLFQIRNPQLNDARPPNIARRGGQHP